MTGSYDGLMIRTSCLSVVGVLGWMVGLGVVVPGCTTPTYINIPGQASDIARNDPNGRNVVDLMAKAIEASVQAEGGLGDGAYEILLPAGSTQATYEQVVLRVGGGAITPDTLRESPVPSVAVAGVRVRNRDAEVDLVRPSPTGRAAVTVELFWYYGDGWAVERVRPLRLSVEALGWELPTEAPRPLPAGVTMPEASDDADVPSGEPDA